MRMQLLSFLCAGVLLLGTVGMSEAALVGRLPVTPGSTDYQAVYDTEQDITWLANANLANTISLGVPGISAGGSMNWFTALSWIGALNATTQHGGVGFLGFTDWRLPSALNQDGSGPCVNVGCSDSELGHLFYEELGGNPLESVFNSTGDTAEEMANLALFSNVQEAVYWFGTENVSNPSRAWVFDFFSGSQASSVEKIDNAPIFFALAVRDGDVAPVPTPSAILLFATGLLVLIGWGTIGRHDCK